MNQSYSICTFLFSFFFSMAILAQEQVALPAAPEAAAMKEYVDVPVNLYSGIPQMSIPIYAIQGREISVPITLSYHSNGIRVAEEASWVGLGWSLNAGGMITREIRDNDDFGGKSLYDNISTSTSIPYEQGLDKLPKDPSEGSSHNQYYFPSGNVEQYNGTPIAGIMDPCEVGTPDIECFYERRDGMLRSKDVFCAELGAIPPLTYENPQSSPLQLDTEPDLFTFSFGGYSGKFIYDKNAQGYVPLDAQAISIEQTGTMLEPSWLITTPNGFKYYFGLTHLGRQRTYQASFNFQSDGRNIEHLSSIDCTDCGSALSNKGQKYISTWYLEKIVGPNGDEVNFTYEKEAVDPNSFKEANDKGVRPIPNYSEFFPDRLLACSEQATASGDLGIFDFIGNGSCAANIVGYADEVFFRTVSRTAYDRITLQTIQYEYGEVQFAGSPGRGDLLGAVQLDAIKIFSGGDGSNTLNKEFRFEYGYFDSGSRSWPFQNLSNWLKFLQPVHKSDVAIPSNFTDDQFNKRLKLTSVQEFGAGGESIPPHSFSYFEDYDLMLPPKSSLAIDHWGYHNNQHKNIMLIPQVNTDDAKLYTAKNWFNNLHNCNGIALEALPGAERGTDEDYVKGWLLKEVIYPTRGKVDLDYEANLFTVEPRWEKEPNPGPRATLGGTVQGVAWEASLGDFPEQYPSHLTKVPVRMEIRFTVLENSIQDPGFDCDPDNLVITEDAEGNKNFANITLPGFQIRSTDGSFVQNFPVELSRKTNFPPGTNLSHQYDNPVVKYVELDLNKDYIIEILPDVADGDKKLPCDLPSYSILVYWDKYELVTQDFGGGARVKQTDLDDGKGHVITKAYKYPSHDAADNRLALLHNEPSNEYLYHIQYPGGDYCNGYYSAANALELFRYSNSQVPLQSSFAGSYVGYTQVEVWQGEAMENGKTTYEFYNKPTTIDFGQWIAPPNFPRYYDQQNGMLKKQIAYNSGGDPVHQIENFYENEFLDEFWNLHLFTFQDPRNWGIQSKVSSCPTRRISFYYYKEFRQWVKLTGTLETHFFYAEDGTESGPVRKKSRFQYNDQNFQVENADFTDSDDRTYVTYYDYPVTTGLDEDLIASAAALEALGMINTVLAQRMEVVGGGQVGGRKTTYQVITIGNDDYIVPETLFQWEGNAWDSIGTFTEYYADAFPKTFQKAYYTDPDQFFWYGYGAAGDPQLKGLLAKKTYKDFEWEFEYDSANRKLAKRIEPDDTYSVFVHDGLQRLSTATQFGNNNSEKSTATMTYNYGDPAGDGNNIASRIDYADETPTKEAVKYYDGLGRYYKTITKGYFEDNVDVITDEIVFDNFGRRDEQTFLVGNFKDLIYEPSPLNRLEQEILPDGHTIQYKYGSEITAIGQLPGENAYYTQTVSETVRENYRGSSTDKNISVKTLTDKQGRQFKIVDAHGKETVYYYDDYGNIERIVTPKGSEYSYTFDEQNRLASKTVPGAGTTTYEYVEVDDPSNGRDLLLSQTDGEGIKVSMKYDDYDRVTHTYLGEVGGDRMIENIYYTEGHVDKIKETLNQVFWGGAATDTKDSYQYDEFGRIKQHSFQHLEGTDITINTLNHADQLKVMSLDHSGFEALNVEISNTFDRYDRTKSAGHSIEGYGQISLSDNMSYNKRGQLLTKTIGGGLFSYTYHYNGPRGWLEQINDPLNSDLVLPACDFEEFEDLNPPLDLETEEYVDDIPFYDFLKIRYSANLSFVDEPLSCPSLPCISPNNPCSTGAAAQNYADITESLRQTVSVQREVPCADGSTEVIDVISTEPVFFPTNLFRVRFCDDSEAYVLAEYLDQITGDFIIVQDIKVNAPTQTFNIQIGNKAVVYNFSELLGLLIAGDEITVGDYIPCGVPNCDLDLSCTAGEIAAQQAALEQLKQNLDELDAYTLSYPVYLYAVELCDSKLVYLLEDELEVIESTTMMVVDTLIFNAPEDRKPIRQVPPENSTGPGGLFHMKFAYQPNGNIDELYWQMAGRALSEYDLRYDLLNRMTDAYFSQYINGGSQRSQLNAYGVNGINYDEDGNLELLQRRGLVGYCENGLPEYGLIDDLDYGYGAVPNQLTDVTDGADPEKGFIGSSSSYSYDGAGNLTNDGAKGLMITYNHLNLPKTITGNGGSIEIIYDAAGRKLRKIVTSPDDTYTFDYISGIEFRDGELEAVYHQEGRFFVPKAEEGQEAEDPRYEFFLKDHLGNTRLVIADRDGSGGIDITEDPATNELLQENHYYPFGMNQEGPWAQPFVLDDQGEITLDEDGKPVVDQVRLAKYQYNGKELNGDLGLNWLDYGARWYDASIGRWNAVDPLAEKYYSFSTYGYTANNPINYIDPDGAQITPVISYQGEGENRKAVITLRVTGKVIDLSGGLTNDAYTLASRLTFMGISLSGQMVDVTGLGYTDSEGNELSGNVVLNFDFQFKATDRISEINNSDHLMVIAPFNNDIHGFKDGGALGITNMNGGRVMHIDGRLTRGLGSKSMGTATHEIIAHSMAAVSFKNEDRNTIAYEPTQNKSFGFTSEQGRTILEHYQAGRLNQGPVLSQLHSRNMVPYTGWHHSSGKSGNIFQTNVGVNREKYINAALKKQ